MNNIFYSDLDLTLIYSHRAMRKYHNNSYEALVVEEHENKPLSYMKLEAWEKLVKDSSSLYQIIPTTTRTFEQYSRIRIPRLDINYCITSNGGRIHYKGIEDLEWSKHIDGEINNYALTPLELFKEYEKDFYNIPGVNKVRCANGFFVYIVKDEAENHLLEEFLKDFESQHNYIVSHQGRKSYIVPKILEKGYAISYLNDKLKVNNSVSAGDSKLDLSMAGVTNAFIQPKHGEAVGMLSNALITEKLGIDSGVELLEFASKSFEK